MGLDYIVNSAGQYAIYNGMRIWYESTSNLITDVSLLLADGNTIARYYFDASVTKIDASVSLWADMYGSGNDLSQTTGANQPAWSSSGVLFDGVDDLLLKYPAVAEKAQPIFVYMVAKEITHTEYDTLFYLNDDPIMGLREDTADPGVLTMRGGGLQINPVSSSDNVWGIYRLLWNGVNSKFIYNNNTPYTGDASTSPLTIIQIGGSGTSSPNIEVKEMIIRNENNATNETIIYNYLTTKYDNDITNMIRNGRFDTSVYWAITGDCSIYNNITYFGVVAQGSITQQNNEMAIPFEPNQSYRLTFDISIISGNAVIDVGIANGLISFNTGGMPYPGGTTYVNFDLAGDIAGGGIKFISHVTSANPFSITNIFCKKIS